jgi:hypothetical protein
MKILWISLTSVCLVLGHPTARAVTVFNDTFESAGASRNDDANDAADTQWRPRIGSQAGAYSITNDPTFGSYALKFRQTANSLWLISQFDNDGSDGVMFGSNSIPVALGPHLNDTVELSLKVRVAAPISGTTRSFQCGLVNVPAGPLAVDPGTDSSWINPCAGYFIRIKETTPGLVETYKQLGSTNGVTPYQGVPATITNLSLGITGVTRVFGADTAAHSIQLRLTRVESGIQIDSYWDGTLAGTAVDDGTKGAGSYSGSGPYNTFNTVGLLYGTGNIDYIVDDVKLTSNWAQYEPPLGTDDAYSLNQDTTLTVSAPGVLRNDLAYTNVPPLAAIKLTDPAHGTLTSFGGDGGFVYVPDTNFYGTDSFTYKANDGTSYSPPVTVALTVLSTGYYPPIAVDDAYSVGQNTLLTVSAPGVLSNDKSWTNVPPLSATKLTDPVHGTLVSFGSDGAFVYMPETNYFGTDSFTYTITDGSNGTATATVTLAIASLADRAFISLKPFCARPDGAQTCVAVVKVFNAAGAPAAGQTVTLASSRGAADVIGPANPQTTDANGEATFTIKSSTAGTSTITAECSGATISRGIIEEGAVGLWSFEGDATDSSGLNNHGTLQNSPTFVAGRSGQAITFNGLNQYVEVAHNNNLNNRQAWTIDAWMYVDSLPTNKSVILQKSSGSDGDFYLSCSNRLLHARCATRGGADDLNKYAIETANSVLSAGKWTHLVAVWAGDVSDPVWDDGTLRIFVDGVQKVSWDIARYLCRNQTQPLNIGRNPVGGNYFQGRLDEVRLYNRALYPPEIQRSFEFATTVHFDLAPPTGVNAQPADPESVELRWTPSANTNLTTYRIYRSTSPGVVVSPTNQIDEVPYFVTCFRDYKVNYGVPYYYLVTACSYSNESAASGETTATAVKAAVAPRWYGGDTHVHSINSWDVWYHPPTELASAAKALGFDFLFLTDHDSIVGRHEMHTNSTATFLAMQGEEVSLSSGGDNDHFNAFFINHYVPGTGVETDLHDQVRSQGGFAMPNHCGYYTESTNIDGLEVIHGASVKSDTVNAWDWYLKQDFKLMGRGSTDNHGDCGKVTTLVWLERLCYSELYNAFKYGRAIAVTGPGIECMLKVNGAMIGDTLAVPAGQPLNVEITAKSDVNITTVELVKHGTIVWSATPNATTTTNTYLDTSGETNTYFRLQVRDAAGKRALGGAVYIRYQPVQALTIQATAGSGGFISPAGAVPVTTGASTNFLIWTLPDYRIADVKTNSASIGLAFDNQSTNCDWTWANITQSGDIVAQFAPRLTPNGIPFTWLSEHGITNRQDTVEQEDPDQDGFTNLQEYIADTDPSSDTSTVPALQIRQGGGGQPELFVELTSPERSYCLLSQTNLVTGADWQTNLWTLGSGSNLVYTATNSARATFYRLRISR